MTTIPTRTRSRQRYASAAENIRRQSRISSKAWESFRQIAQAIYGRSFGDQLIDWIRRGEHDFAFASEKLLGVPMFDWQIAVVDALQDHRYIPVKMPNSGGKTTMLTIIDMLYGFYRSHVTPQWGSAEYRILHLAPEETQALELYRKANAILNNTAREQMFKIPGGFDFRKCWLAPFFEEGQPDKKHSGFFINDGASTITCRPTSYRAKGSDGTDPALVTWDELRHEKRFNEVLNTIVMPRFLRVPFGRAIFPFTPIEASVELIMAYNRGTSGLPDDIDWFSVAADDLRRANPTVSDETIARANRNIDKRYRPMVLSGQPIQPMGSKFAQASVDEAFYGTVEPEWLGDLSQARTRVVERCPVCRAIRSGESVLHQNSQVEHPMVGFVDPASSSAGADAIVAVAADLQPPDFPKHWMDVVYIEELPVGTKVQRIGAHVAMISMVIHGPCAFDANTALGHNVIDEITDFPTAEEVVDGPEGRKHIEAELRAKLSKIDLAPEPDCVPMEHNKRVEKDEDLDFLGGLLDIGKMLIAFHLRARMQLTNYTRKDEGIQQDFVMALAGLCWMAKGDLPDMASERTRRDKGGRAKIRQPGADDVFAGLGAVEDVYFSLPGDIGQTLGGIDAYGAERGNG